jgi:uncharacterized membrane protein (UPF0127 family)
MDSNYKRSILLFENYCKQDTVDNKTIDCNLGKCPMKLKIASTPQSQLKGYQDEKEPSDNEGILFVYPSEIQASFWMKDVSFPLDILFFNSNKELIDSMTMSPDSYPKIFTCKKPAQYAVETRSGWYARHGNKSIKLSI